MGYLEEPLSLNPSDREPEDDATETADKADNWHASRADARAEWRRGRRLDQAKAAFRAMWDAHE